MGRKRIRRPDPDKRWLRYLNPCDSVIVQVNPFVGAVTESVQKVERVTDNFVTVSGKRFRKFDGYGTGNNFDLNLKELK